MNSLRRTLIAVTAVATLTLTGCGGSDSDADTGSTSTPDASSSPSASESASESATASAKPSPSKTPPAEMTTVEVTIQGGSVTPVAQQVEIGVGETLALNIDSDRVGELHVHATPEQTFAIRPGRSTAEVTLDKPGQVDIEEHESGALLVRALVR
jgi:hypothetical protein